MTHYYIGADRCDSSSKAVMNTIAKELRKCGHKATVGQITSHQESISYRVKKSWVFLFLTCGVAPETVWSFKTAIAKGASPSTIFCHCGWSGQANKSTSPMRSEQAMLNHAFVPEHDAVSQGNITPMKKDGGKAKTVGAYAEKYSQYVGVAWAKTPKELAQKICNGQVTGFGSNVSGTTENSSSSGSGSSSSSSTSSPLLDGTETFEDLIGTICNGIDLLFLCKRGVVVVDDFESIYAEAKYLRDNNSDVVKGENVNLWQIEDDSYELEVNQHGFYNTVYVKYKNGTVKESYDEFVNVYGEIPITYKHPKLDKSSAIMKAKAYLAAHVRDFGMTVNLSMLADGDIDIGDVITVDNPNTSINKTRIAKGLDPEYLFVNGKSINWEGDSYISMDLELVHSPTSPEAKEVPFSQ